MTSLFHDPQYCPALFEAQFLMGHRPANEHRDHDRRTILRYSWNVDQVRQALPVPLTALWGERMLTLEMQGLASFSVYCAPVYHDDDGVEHEIEGWQDQPRDDWGEVNVHPQGVLRLAEWYGRPYVRFHESPALVAHWRLVQAETAARLHVCHDEERFAREWPERWAAWQAYNQKFGDEHGG